MNVTKGYRTSTKQNGKKFVKCPGLIINDGNFVVVDGGCLDGASGPESWIFNYRLLHTWNIHVLEVSNYRIYIKLGPVKNVEVYTQNDYRKEIYTRPFTVQYLVHHPKKHLTMIKIEKSNTDSLCMPEGELVGPYHQLGCTVILRFKKVYPFYILHPIIVCFCWAESIQCRELCQYWDCFSDSVGLQ